MGGEAEARRFVDRMIKAISLEIDGEVVERDRPDFAFRLPCGKTIGLEVTQSRDQFKAPALAVSRRLEARIKAELCGRKLGDVEVFVQLSMQQAGFLNLDATQLQRNAKAIAAEADRILPVARAANTDDYCWSTPETLAARGIEHIELVAVARSPYQFVRATVYDECGPSEGIQQAIDKKAKKLETYESTFQADEYWLLVAGGHCIGGLGEIWETEDRTYMSPFKRTFFLDGDRCVELEIGPAR